MGFWNWIKVGLTAVASGVAAAAGAALAATGVGAPAGAALGRGRQATQL